MTQEIEDVIDEMRHATLTATFNYEVWWVFKSSDTRPIYVDTMNRYRNFFYASIHAHFVAMITSLYRIFETRKDTFNFEVLLRKLANQPGACNVKIDKFRARYEKLKPIWVKVGKLRNQAFGHRSLEASVDEVFENAEVTPDEIRDFIKETQNLLNDLSQNFFQSSYVFDIAAREDTLRVLEDLQSVNTTNDS